MANIYKTFMKEQAERKAYLRSVVRFKKLHPSATIPKRAKDGDAWFDLHALNCGSVCGEQVIDTGVACAIPEGYVGLIWPRSGLSVKNGASILAGVIDSGYRGPVMAAIQSERSFAYKAGDRIAQMVVVPYMGEAVEVDELDDTDRGEGGFGSSGR